MAPWDSSSSSSSSSGLEDDLVPHEEEDDGEPLVFKSDHEFSCESDAEDADGGHHVPTKVARTVKRRKRTPKKQKVEAVEAEEEEEEQEAEEEEEEEEFPCKKCGISDHPEWILLCDDCDEGYHAACLRPPLMLIPVGDWFCPNCEHKKLIASLEDALADFRAEAKKRESDEEMRKRLEYVNVSLANIIDESDRRKRGGTNLDSNSYAEDDTRRAKKAKTWRESIYDSGDESESESESDSGSLEDSFLSKQISVFSQFT